MEQGGLPMSEAARDSGMENFQGRAPEECGALLTREASIGMYLVAAGSET